MSEANIKGAVFEEIIKRFARTAGYRPVDLAQTDNQLFHRPNGMPMVHGLGEAHNADVLLVPPVQFPLSPTTRLLIECKGYKDQVGLGVVRGAVGLRTDLNAFRQLSNSTLERRKKGGHSGEKPLHFPYFHVAVASLFGFSSAAQHYSAAHHVELLDYSSLPILGSLSAKLRDLPRPGRGLPDRWRAYIERMFDESAAQLPHADLNDVETGLGPDIVGRLGEIRDAVLPVRASYVVTLANGLTVNVLSEAPLALPPRTRGADFRFKVGFGDVTSPAWWFEVNETRLEFNVPGELVEAWQERGRTLEGAVDLKANHMGRIELVGPVADAFGGISFRHCVGEIDQEFLRTAWERARRRRGARN